MESYTVSKALTTPDTSQGKLSREERERTKELRRMHIGEHAERSWEFQSEIRARLAELPDVSVAVAADAAAMLREVMFWEIKAEHRDFWVYRVVKCKECDPDPEHNCCWHKMGLSKRNVHAARQLLVEWGLLEYTNGKGLPSGYFNRTHYRVKQLAVMNFREKPPTVVNEVHRGGERDAPGDQVDGPNEPTRWTERTNYTESTQSEPISLTESTPDGVGFEFEVQESHERRHDTLTSTTSPREPKSLSVGERIARYVHNNLKEYYGSELTDVEFSALVKDVNELWRYGYRHDGTVDLEELYEAADWLVGSFEYGDGRPYPPRAGDPLIVLAFEACGFGY